MAIRYVGIARFDETKAEVYAQVTSEGHYHVFARDGVELDGFGKDVKYIEDIFDNERSMYRVTHAGIKKLGDKYDVVIFTIPTEAMNNLKSIWESDKDLPGSEDYARTWFEPITTGIEPELSSQSAFPPGYTQAIWDSLTQGQRTYIKKVWKDTGRIIYRGGVEPNLGTQTTPPATAQKRKRANDITAAWAAIDFVRDEVTRFEKILTVGMPADGTAEREDLLCFLRKAQKLLLQDEFIDIVAAKATFHFVKTESARLEKTLKKDVPAKGTEDYNALMYLLDAAKQLVLP